MKSENTIHVQTFGSLNDALVIDVRTPVEYAQQFLAGSRNIPLAELRADHVKVLALEGQDSVYLLCGTGMRASKAAAQLRDLLPQALVVIEGGIEAMEAAGHELVKGAGRGRTLFCEYH
ncbi:MAG: rhodanese-related sulfurtransferase [Candidatus Azotimanducaceae bacterium]|jgi:rhodanese-related sulfurtransferase